MAVISVMMLIAAYNAYLSCDYEWIVAARGRAVGSASVPLNGSVRFAGLWSKVLPAEERTELFENQNALTHPLKDETTVREENIIQDFSLFDNRAAEYADAEAGYFYSLPYARAEFTTSATSMGVEIWNSNNEVAPAGRYFNVRVNGVDNALPEAAQSTGAATTHTIALPAGSKTV